MEREEPDPRAQAEGRMSLTVGSLFSGIGGLELGLERAGMQVKWQVEIDPYCRRVLEKHWPGVPKFEDVRNVGAAQLESVDLICGGFPCQDISNAGKQVGIDGERSGLWSEFARIVRALRPRYVLVENVAALLGRGLERVLGDLAACGYDAEWDCLPAAAFSAPHRRDRLFLVAYANRGRELQPQGREQDQRRLVSNSGADVPDAQQLGAQVQAPWIFAAEQMPECASWWATEPDVGRVADGVPSRVDRLRCLGNAVVPQVAEYIGRAIQAANEVRIGGRHESKGTGRRPNILF